MSETFVDREQVLALLAARGPTPLVTAALRFATVAARRMNDPSLIEPLLEAAAASSHLDYDRGHGAAVCAAITAAVAARGGLHPAILALARDPRGDLREAVAAGLPEHDPASRDLLREMLHDRHAGVRQAARGQLGPWARGLPWWSGLLSRDPGPRFDRAARRRLKALEQRIALHGALDAEGRAMLDALPPRVAIDVLEGLLTAALAQPKGQSELLATLLEARGGLDLLCRLLGGLPPAELWGWRAPGSAALAMVAPRRRARVVAALVHRALTLPRTPRGPDVPAWRIADVPGLLASWVADGGARGAAPILKALAEVPVAESHQDVREKIGGALARATGVRVAPLAERMLRAEVAGDRAAMAQVGGAPVASRLAERAGPALRRQAALEMLEADAPAARARALDVLLDDGLAEQVDRPRLRAALERQERDAGADARPLGAHPRHTLPLQRAKLRAGALLDDRDGATVLALIGARAGGVWPADEVTPPLPPLDVGGTEGEVSPPTAEEWAAYRAARASRWAADPERGVWAWIGSNVLPAGAWTEDDWRVVEAVVDAATRGAKHARMGSASAAEVLRLERSPRALRLLARLRAAGFGEPADDALIGPALAAEPAPPPSPRAGGVAAPPAPDLEDW